jgi:hypothetical protein
MTAFCRWWALAGIGLVALASLGLRSDNSDIVGKQADAPIGALGCEVNASNRCMVEIRYACPAADLSVVLFDAYF